MIAVVLPSPLWGRGGDGGAGGAFSGEITAVTPAPGPAPQGGGELQTLER
jgi:hypothetical protein